MRDRALLAGRASADSTKPGRPFFICTGGDPHVERARGEAALRGVGHELRREVVEVGLDHDAPPRRRRRPALAGALADEHADHVRAIRRARGRRRRSRARRGAARAADRTGSRARRRRRRRSGSRARRRHRRHGARAPRSSSSVAGAGSGSRPCAVPTKPRAIGSGEHSSSSISQRLERERDAADVADRIERADLVEVDLLGLDAVDAGLGDGRARRTRPGRARAGARKGRRRRSSARTSAQGRCSAAAGVRDAVTVARSAATP